MDNFLTAFQNYAISFPDKVACIFLEKGESETSRITYGELNKRAQAIAVYLQQQGIAQQQCVALLYPPGIEFVAAFIGCLYAGLIAIPLPYPMKSNFHNVVPSLKAIIHDASINSILTTGEFTDQCVKDGLQNIFADKTIWDTTKINPEVANNFRQLLIDKSMIACLQYTSGSTSNPKGVIITHDNLIHSLAYASAVWDYSPGSVSLMWPSHSHIYGLTTGLLTPLINGSLCIIMPAMAFLLRPIRWLRAISNYRITHSGCPNFGYEICINQIKDQQLAGIDLGSWKVAINGGEPIQAITLEKFCKRFFVYGFRYESFCPAYGMSEMTGLIATTKVNEAANCYEQATFDGSQLSTDHQQHNKVQKFIGCGKSLQKTSIKVVHPETHELVAEGQVGELCLAGPTCMSGYWGQKDSDTAHFFMLPDAGGEKKYLRTGDLGFVKNGELVVTGRLKDVVIISGKNHYVFDIEATVETSHPNLNQDNAAFSLCQDGCEKLFIVQEVDVASENDYKEMVMAVRKSVSDKHNIDTHGILFAERNTLPKTGSGKKKRYLCKEYYLNNRLNILYHDIKL